MEKIKSTRKNTKSRKQTKKQIGGEIKIGTVPCVDLNLSLEINGLISFIF